MGWTEEELELYPYLNNYTVPEYFKQYGFSDENIIKTILLTKNGKFTFSSRIRIHFSSYFGTDSLFGSLLHHMVGSKKYLCFETPWRRTDDLLSEICSGKGYSGDL